MESFGFDIAQRKIERMADTMSGASMGRILTDVGVQTRPIFETSAAEWAGTDRRLSGWPRAGVMGVGFDVTPKALTMKPRPYGLWIVGDRGRRSTTIPKRRARVTVNTPGGPRTFLKSDPLVIGSTRGHRTLTIARERAQDQVPRWIFERWQRELREGWV
jgi:hypothetical protein